MYAFIAAACFPNLTKMRTDSSSDKPESAPIKCTVTSTTSPYFEHSSPISPLSSASTSAGATMFLSSSTRDGRPRNVTAPFFSPPALPATPPAAPPAVPGTPLGGGGGAGSGGGGGGLRSDALTMTPVRPSLFLAMSGVRIPWPSLPRPWPSLHPIFWSIERPGSPLSSLKPGGKGGGGGGSGSGGGGGAWPAPNAGDESARGRLAPAAGSSAPPTTADASEEKALEASSCFRWSAASSSRCFRIVSTSFTHSS
mmetsp:Transcript_37618/g.82818  ORF Transcript_37618/g.82818 Transcript_37618/m.82818 type:complete len:254 (-) Transcript_37618:772-1533(-)